MCFISIIVVTYNSQKTILDCLNSILAQKQNEVEVIIVDNASSDRTAELIRDGNYECTLIGNRRNLGYGAALNQGIEHAKGDYILTLNSDVVLERDFVKKFRKQVGSLPSNIGMISPKIMRPDGRIDSAGLFLSFLRRFYDKGKGRVDNGRYALSGYIFGPCGACAIYKRMMLREIKLRQEYFDGDFFLLAEDFDLAWRANLMGWKGWFMPEIRCLHLGGVSRVKTKISRYYAFRNRYFLLIKNESKRGLLRLFLLFWIYDLPRITFLLVTNNNILKALKEINNLLPLMIEKRKLIQSKIAREEVFNL